MGLSSCSSCRNLIFDSTNLPSVCSEMSVTPSSYSGGPPPSPRLCHCSKETWLSKKAHYWNLTSSWLWTLSWPQARPGSPPCFGPACRGEDATATSASRGGQSRWAAAGRDPGTRQHRGSSCGGRWGRSPPCSLWSGSHYICTRIIIIWYSVQLTVHTAPSTRLNLMSSQPPMFGTFPFQVQLWRKGHWCHSFP